MLVIFTEDSRFWLEINNRTEAIQREQALWDPTPPTPTPLLKEKNMLFKNA